MDKKFYISSTLPYVNSDPHVGFALEIVQADAIARHHTLLGEEVVFNFGTDEHGQKIYQKALEEKKLPIISSELERIANSFVELTDEQETEVMEMVEKMEQDDDVQKVYHNIK